MFPGGVDELRPQGQWRTPPEALVYGEETPRKTYIRPWPQQQGYHVTVPHAFCFASLAWREGVVTPRRLKGVR